MKDLFRSFAERTAEAVGAPWAFALVVVSTIVWLIAGPFCHFSDTWQLTMNTIASQVTFLIAFLLQNTQNRDSRALHLKLDELIRATQNARTDLIHLERLSDDELIRLQEEFEAMAERVRTQRQTGGETPTNTV